MWSESHGGRVPASCASCIEASPRPSAGCASDSQRIASSISPHYSVYSLVLDQRCPLLRDLFQGLRDRVGGHPLGPEIEHHAFFIVSPIDTINEIIAGRAIDVDRAHEDLLGVLTEDQ